MTPEEKRGAVFLSYASEDAPPLSGSQRACAPPESRSGSTRASFGEVEAWDGKNPQGNSRLRALIPISPRTRTHASRGTSGSNGSSPFDRSHLMAPDRTFLLPVVIDDTPQTDERIPDRFRDCSGRVAPGDRPRLRSSSASQRLLSPAQANAPTTPGGERANGQPEHRQPGSRCGHKAWRG